MPQSVAGSSGGLKTASGGYFIIPAGPAVGTTVNTSISANTYGSWTEMVASTSAALYIVGVSIEVGSGTQSYFQLDIGTGAAASETSVGEWKFDHADTVTDSYVVTFPYPIPVATSTRIACRTACSEAAARDAKVALICINQADVVSI